MEDLTARMNVLDTSLSYEIKERFEALGIHLEGELLAKKTMAFLEFQNNLILKGEQYNIARELAWEAIT